jgi:hypothetical protein
LADLAEIAFAVCVARAFANPLQHRQQDGDEKSDDGHRDHHFDEREASLLSRPSWFRFVPLHPAISPCLKTGPL